MRKHLRKLLLGVTDVLVRAPRRGPTRDGAPPGVATSRSNLGRSPSLCEFAFAPPYV